MGGVRRSRSRSSSSSPERVDRFGRVIPKHRSRSRDRLPARYRDRSPQRRSRDRSRTRDSRRSPSHVSLSSRLSNRSRRSRSRSRDRFRRRSRSREHYRRSRSRGRSPRRRSPSPPPENITSVEDPELLQSRIFIGNLPVDKITKPELEGQFSKYGKIIGVSLHERGFGFVQYEKESEAHQAVENENGGLLKGKKLDIKMALEGRRGAPNKGRRPSPGSKYEGSDGGYPPARDGRGAPPPPAGRGPSATRERSPLRADPYDDRYRDPYRDPLPPPPPVRDDPYYPPADPYRRPLPPDDPYYDRYREDPYRYRRDPYGPPDPYRDPYRDLPPRDLPPRDLPPRDLPPRDLPPYDVAPPPRKPLPIDCHIILTSANLRNYGDFLERKIKALSLYVNSSVIGEDKTIPQMIEEASKRGVLFAIVINSQNEVHQSLTLNILHGTPQEHRNMPVEDAIGLIGRSFEQHQKSLREKEAPPSASAPAGRRSPPPFIPPGPDITYLLNLLADNRQLTIEELDKVIGYLRQRRDKLLEAEGRLPPQPDEGKAVYGGGGDRKEDAASLQKQQQELQAKIMSILNGPGESSTPGMGMGGQGKGVPPAGRPALDRGMGNGQTAGQGMPSLINFDNPSVKKALDNLISSGPNLLKSISSPPPGVSQSQPQMSRDGGLVEMRRDAHMLAREGGYGGASAAPGGGIQSAHVQAPPRMYGGAIQSQPRGQMPPGVRPQRF